MDISEQTEGPVEPRPLPRGNRYSLREATASWDWWVLAGGGGPDSTGGPVGREGTFCSHLSGDPFPTRDPSSPTSPWIGSQPLPS